MIIYYMKHAWSMLWQDKFFTIISLLGIGVAVAFIMVILTVNEIDNASISPESNRYRTLYVRCLTEKSADGTSMNNSSLSPSLVKEVFYNLKGVDGVTATCGFIEQHAESRLFSGEGEVVPTMNTDGSYWKFFDFDFVEGKPFTASDFQSGMRVVVICQSLAQSLYKGESAVGKDIYLTQQPYRVVGVVKDVSPSNTYAYAKVWMPYTTEEEVMSMNQSSCGMLSVLILAKDPSDFKTIAKEVEQNRKRYNLSLGSNITVDLHGPDTHFEQRFRESTDEKDSHSNAVAGRWLAVILVLMVVPALNMASFTISRMKKRQEELGLRRSFGALKGDIAWQVVSENMLLTLMGGIAGFLLSIVILLVFKSSIYPDGVNYSLTYFIRPTLFGYLLLCCIAINLLSALVPSLIISKQPIVNALKRN